MTEKASEAGYRPTQGTIDLLLEFEVGGEELYIAKYQRPIWPEGASGVTVGIGYDLGHNTAAQIRADWSKRLPADDVDRLVSVAGKKGLEARAALSSVRNRVRVPWAAAWPVFIERTVPRYWRQTRQAFPGVENLAPDCQGALLSLVFNRGPLVNGTNRRKEMLLIRQAIAAGRPGDVPGLLRAMVRIWRGTSIEGGMTRRRRAEAELFARGLRPTANPLPSPANPPGAGRPVVVKVGGKTYNGLDVYSDPEEGAAFLWARSAADALGWTVAAVEKDPAADAGEGSALVVFSRPDGPDQDSVPDEVALPLLITTSLDGETRGFVRVRDLAVAAGLDVVWDSGSRTATVTHPSQKTAAR